MLKNAKINSIAVDAILHSAKRRKNIANLCRIDEKMQSSVGTRGNLRSVSLFRVVITSRKPW